MLGAHVWTFTSSCTPQAWESIVCQGTQKFDFLRQPICKSTCESSCGKQRGANWAGKSDHRKQSFADRFANPGAGINNVANGFPKRVVFFAEFPRFLLYMCWFRRLILQIGLQIIDSDIWNFKLICRLLFPYHCPYLGLQANLQIGWRRRSYF